MKKYNLEYFANGQIIKMKNITEEIINNKLREYKKCKIEFTDDIDIDCELHCAFMEDGNIIEPKRLSKHEVEERQRRKEKKEFERERKEYEDR